MNSPVVIAGIPSLSPPFFSRASPSPSRLHLPRRQYLLIPIVIPYINIFILYLISGCSLGYKQINSQIAEQKNSQLSRIKPQLSYTSPKNFVMHAELFISFQNKKKKTSILTS